MVTVLILLECFLLVAVITISLLATSTLGLFVLILLLISFVVSRNFQRLNIDKLNEILTYDDIWDEKFDNPSDCLECFNLIMSYLLDLLIPPRTLRTRWQNCPWLSSCAFARTRHLHDVAHRKALDWSNYRVLHNKATSMLRSAKTAYFNGQTSTLSTKPGKFWRHFHCLSRHSKSVNNDVQLLVTANDFINHFLAIPHKTVANVSSVFCTSYRILG